MESTTKWLLGGIVTSTLKAVEVICLYGVADTELVKLLLPLMKKKCDQMACEERAEKAKEHLDYMQGNVDVMYSFIVLLRLSSSCSVRDQHLFIKGFGNRDMRQGSYRSSFFLCGSGKTGSEPCGEPGRTAYYPCIL